MWYKLHMGRAYPCVYCRISGVRRVPAHSRPSITYGRAGLYCVCMSGDNHENKKVLPELSFSGPDPGARPAFIALQTAAHQTSTYHSIRPVDPYINVHAHTHTDTHTWLASKCSFPSRVRTCSPAFSPVPGLSPKASFHIQTGWFLTPALYTTNLLEIIVVGWIMSLPHTNILISRNCYFLQQKGLCNTWLKILRMGSSPELSRWSLKVITCVLKKWARDSPGGPVVKIPCFHCRGHRFSPWLGN